jgi:undecaprenyl-diphosphatase
VLLVSLSSLVLLALAYTAARQHPLAGDITVTRAIQSSDLPGLAAVMYAATVVGGEFWAPALTVAVAAGLACFGRRREAGLVLLTLLIRLPNILVKEVVERPRPSTDAIQVFFPVNESSFPSGHAGGALIFFGLLAYLAWLRLSGLRARLLVLTGCMIAILLIGISRIYFGAHWPSDVVGGYAYGGMMLGLLIEVHRRLERRAAGAEVARTVDRQGAHSSPLRDAADAE